MFFFIYIIGPAFLINHITPCKFFTSSLAAGLSLESKTPQVSRALLRILTNDVVCLVSISPPISNSSNPFTNDLGNVPSVPITVGITVTFMFHNFFSSLARSKYLSLFSFSLIFVVCRNGKVHSSVGSILF